MKLIAGDPQNYVAVDFPQEYSVEDLERELTKALDSLKDCDGILVLSDLGGGSPFKTAVMVGYPRGCLLYTSSAQVMQSLRLKIVVFNEIS